MITLIAACSKNRIIGNDNKLIWNVPGDLKRFKELTSGHTILMGRKTYESIGKPLPNRRNIVLSRNTTEINNCLVYSSLIEVLNLYKNDLFVIGGGEIYKQCLPYADKIELTYIDKDFEGDTYFPIIDESFKITNKIDNVSDNFNFSYITYER